MRRLSALLLFIFILISVYGCKQYEFATIKDLEKIPYNKYKYIGKPLSYFLKDVKPPIYRYAFVFERNPRYKTYPPLIMVYMYPFSENDLYKKIDENPIIFVYLKEKKDFNYPFTRGARTPWTDSSYQVYKNDTVVCINYYVNIKEGSNKPCEFK